MTHLLYCFPSSFHLKPTSQDYTLGPNLACLDARIMCCESPSDIVCWSLSFPSVTGKSVKTLNLRVQIHCIPAGGVRACFPHVSQAQGCRVTSQQRWCILVDIIASITVYAVGSRINLFPGLFSRGDGRCKVNRAMNAQGSGNSHAL